VKHAPAAVLWCLAILYGIVGTASGAYFDATTKNRVGVLEQNPDIRTYVPGSPDLDLQGGYTIYGYDPFSGVVFYVRQNPWTKFDPLGLYTGEGLYYGSDENPYESWASGPTASKQVSLAVDFVPYVGTAKGVNDIRTGRDTFTGEKFSKFEMGVAVVGTVASVVPLGKPLAKLGGKLVGGIKSLIHGGGEAVSAVVNTTDNIVQSAQVVSRNTEFIGNPQKTGPGHDVASVRVGEQLADAGAEKVFYNKSLKTVTDGAVDSKLRPDVSSVTNGKVDVIEIPSPSQTVQQMQEKINNMDEILGDLSGGKSRVEPIVEQDKL
jgi:Pre-toxin TG